MHAGFTSKGYPTVRTLRRLVGMPAHRPSGFNACVGAQLKKKTYATPAPGMGGMNDKRIQNAFTAAAKSCAGK
jgi:hypothetical protein